MTGGPPSGPAAAFDAAVAVRGWRVRAEEASDAAFLQALFLANAPLSAVLPRAMLLQQHDIQEASFRDRHAQAMHRILLRNNEPVGRIVIDWGEGGEHSIHGLDIAVLPAARGGGLLMLRAWLKVSDEMRRPTSLYVRADNRARALYARLGFAETPGQAADAPMVKMERGFFDTR